VGYLPPVRPGHGLGSGVSRGKLEERTVIARGAGLKNDDATKEKISRHFSGHGRVEDVELIQSHTGRGVVARIVFDHFVTANEVLLLPHEHVLEGNVMLELHRPGPRGKRGGSRSGGCGGILAGDGGSKVRKRKAKGSPGGLRRGGGCGGDRARESRANNVVYVGNLSSGVTWREVKEFMQEKVGPCHVKQLRFRQGMHVTFECPEHAARALDLNQRQFMGNTLIVDRAHGARPPKVPRLRMREPGEWELEKLEKFRAVGVLDENEFQKLKGWVLSRLGRTR